MIEKNPRLPETVIPRSIEVIAPRTLQEEEVKFLILKPKDYICEIKYDGIRSVIVIENGSIRILTVGHDNKTNRNVSAHLPELVEALKPIAYAHSTAVIDGEIIAGQGKKSQRGNVISRISISRPFDISLRPVGFVPFDLLYLDGIDLRRLQLMDRKERLGKLFPYEYRRRFKIKPSKMSRRNFLIFAYQAAEAGYEGVVFKRRNGLYLPGRTRWLKHKFTEEELA